MQLGEFEALKKLDMLRREYDQLNCEIDQLTIDNEVTDLKLGHLLKRHHELEEMIRTIEDDLIPDMPA